MIPSKNEWMDALIARHGLDLHKQFSSATVAVCGLGGLGSNIAIALARAGIGKLLLIDFDRVDITNLHRQQYKANQIGLHKADALLCIYKRQSENLSRDKSDEPARGSACRHGTENHKDGFPTKQLLHR